MVIGLFGFALIWTIADFSSNAKWWSQALRVILALALITSLLLLNWGWNPIK